MSGFVGIISPSENPEDRRLLGRMTSTLASRGPDAQKTWFSDRVGLGHAQLHTTFESRDETQPYTLDGSAWIVADARIDERSELVRKLAAAGRPVASGAPDVELILQAYQLWGEACLDHLLGDFAFALWDNRRQRLFCARDHFGVKPFFYAQAGHQLVFGNDLPSLRLSPAVSDRLDELAVADWLLFGYRMEPAASTYRDVRRLPPAHRLTWEHGSLNVARYWELRREEPLRYPRAEQYLDHFNEVFSAAVEDRLRWERVGVAMSGGVDSSAVAAAARYSSSYESGRVGLRAFTLVFDRLIPDEERQWAGSVADHLGIPIDYTSGDAYRFGEGWREPESFTPEPANAWFTGLFTDYHRTVLADTRVVLGGMGGDPANRGTSSCYLDLLRRGRIDSLAADVWRTLRAGFRPPLLLRTLWRRAQSRRHRLGEYPQWLRSEWAESLGLAERWREAYGGEPIGWSAYREIQDPFWAVLFEWYDPAWTGFPIEYRQPFFDLRVVRYLLRVPTLPWFMQKHLVRSAMESRLPESVLRRPKTPLAANPTDALVQQEGFTRWREIMAAEPSIGRFVDTEGLITEVREYMRRGGKDIDWLVRSLSLAVWLHHQRQWRKHHEGQVNAEVQASF